jgi:tetratricopeptide (TPR) repeat protein
MGLAYTMLNEFDKALEAYEKVIEIKPDFDEAYCVSNPHIIISCIIVMINLNGFFISLNCLLKLI